MALILGVDPGSQKTGYGLVRHEAARLQYVASGVIRLTAHAHLPDRLCSIFTELCSIIRQYQPTECAVEQVFMAKNAASALKLGQARGAAIVAAGYFQLPVHEYEPRKIKQAVVGTGAACKSQMQHMVMALLQLPRCPQEDAADALGVAICHIHTTHTFGRLASADTFRRGRYR